MSPTIRISNCWAFYANDDWKVTPNLTVNLGLRYEYLTIPLTENTQDLNASASVPGLIEFKSPTAQTKQLHASRGYRVFARHERQNFHPRRVRYHL